MQFSPNQTIDFFPFTCQPDQDGFIVGRAETNTFLALPEEGVRILAWLQSGKTVGETAGLYQQTYGENPDLGDFLETMAESGLIKPTVDPTAETDEKQTAPAHPNQPALVQYHMTWLSESLAKAVFSRTSLWFYALLATSAIAVILANPAVFPSRSDMVFETNVSFWFISFLLFQLSSVMLHEIGHLAAARSRGVNARFGFGNRMWIIVAETDLTGIWSIPKKDRMLPLLGGPMVDVFLLSLGTYLLYALHNGLIVLPDQLAQFARAMFLFLCFRLIWQCYFFVRTDFYYVFTTFFECKNLLKDTEAFVSNKLKGLFRFGKQVDQSAISPREMKVIKTYSWIWGIGRSIALTVLFLYILPILWGYFQIFYTGLTGSGGTGLMIDSLIVIGISFAIYGIGFVMWGRSLFQSMRKRGSKA